MECCQPAECASMSASAAAAAGCRLQRRMAASATPSAAGPLAGMLASPCCIGAAAAASAPERCHPYGCCGACIGPAAPAAAPVPVSGGMLSGCCCQPEGCGAWLTEKVPGGASAACCCEGRGSGQASRVPQSTASTNCPTTVVIWRSTGAGVPRPSPAVKCWSTYCRTTWNAFSEWYPRPVPYNTMAGITDGQEYRLVTSRAFKPGHCAHEYCRCITEATQVRPMPLT